MNTNGYGSSYKQDKHYSPDRTVPENLPILFLYALCAFYTLMLISMVSPEFAASSAS